jgi:hypothetical protein
MPLDTEANRTPTRCKTSCHKWNQLRMLIFIFIMREIPRKTRKILLAKKHEFLNASDTLNQNRQSEKRHGKTERKNDRVFVTYYVSYILA